MKQKYKYEKEHENMMFVELVNFIGHEAYRAAVIIEYLDEYNRILRLNNEVMSELKALRCDEMLSYLDHLSHIFVNSIVLEYPFEELEEKIKNVANQTYPDEILDEYVALKAQIQEETEKIIQIAETLYNSHANWCTNINHRCMPAGLITKVNLKDVINYVESKEYLIGTEIINNREQNFTVVSPPFDSVRMFGDAPKYRFQSQKTDVISIPETSLFNRYIRSNIPSQEMPKFNKTQYQAILRLSFICNKVTQVKFTQSLNVKVDLSSPISKREIELLMNDLYHKITHHQNMNAEASLLLAENLDQLEKAHQSTDLGRFDLAKNMDLTKYQIRGVSSFTDAKNALLGLMAWNEHFIKMRNNYTIVYEKANRHQDDSFAVVAEQFTDEFKKGYGFNTVKKGYSVISIAIQQELAKQRYGRYQKRKMSKERNKALENVPTISFSELHKNDKEVITARLESLDSKGYKGLIKRHEDGSIWIVYRKK